jgi:hypothetical protein
MLCELVGEGKERGWFVIADSLDSYSLLLLTAQKLRGEAVTACGLGRIIPFSLSCFFLFLEGGKEGRKKRCMYTGRALLITIITQRLILLGRTSTFFDLNCHSLSRWVL